MKTYHTLFTASLLAGSVLFTTHAETFSSGSDGSLGELNVTTADVTVTLPPDGRLNYTTVTIAAGKFLRFERNARNTPVFLLAQGDVEVKGIIVLSGQAGPDTRISGLGGPGGFDGGKPGVSGFGANIPPGDGYGPGGGGGGDASLSATGAGSGGHATRGKGNSSFEGSAYGSPLLIPLIGGSGGGGQAGVPGAGPGFGGSGGGGAILIASTTNIRLAAGSIINALGGSHFGDPNAGSGGAVRLLAPRVEGGGIINVSGGFVSGVVGGGGAAGRIRVDCFDWTKLALITIPGVTTTVGTTMFVAPGTVPRLDIANAAGQVIPLDTGSPVRVLLPFGSDTNQFITLRAQDFNADVPIRLTLTPDSGPRIVIDTNIVNTANNPATLVIPVGLPANNLTTIHAWTR